MTRNVSLPQLEFSMLREVLSFLKPDDSRQVWLVGGSIRDLLCGCEVLPDLDLTTSFDPIPAARNYARATGAGFVVLDAERKVVRLVRAVDDLHLTFDLSLFRAENIDADLQARDFTINAIAAKLDRDFASPSLEIYDPLHGCTHLEQRLIIPCSDNLFIDDPLRLMRAFRFSAIYDAEFSPQLAEMVKQQAHLLKDISGERIRDELFKVLGVSGSVKWIRRMYELGIIQVFLPELVNCAGIEQNEWHHLDVFEHTLLTLESLETLVETGQQFEWWQKFTRFLEEIISNNRTYQQLLKFGALLHDLGKPGCRRLDAETGKTIFHGHEMEGVRIAKKVCERLKLSVSELQFLQKVVKNHMRPGVMLQQGISDKRLFRFYSETGRDGTAIALLSLADRMSAQGTLGEGEMEIFAQGIYKIMLQFFEQMKRPKSAPFLTGNDLISLFSLKPGPRFKEILATLEEAQFLGEIKNREEAVDLVKNILK